MAPVKEVEPKSLRHPDGCPPSLAFAIIGLHDGGHDELGTERELVGNRIRGIRFAVSPVHRLHKRFAVQVGAPVHSIQVWQ